MKSSLYRLIGRIRQLPVWCDVVVLTVASGIFFALATARIATDSAYFDEGYSSYLAHLSIGQAAHYTALDVHPPLYYVMLHGWQLMFGDTIVSLRAMSVGWAIVCLILGFSIVRRAFGRRASWAVLPFLVLSPLLIRYAGAARMYTMALAFCLAATYVLVRLKASAEPRARTGLWIIYGLLVVLGLWTNYFTALVWVSHGLWLIGESLIADRRFSLRRLKGWLSALGLALVLYLPWLPVLINRTADVQYHGFWIKPLSLDTFASTLSISLSLRPSSAVTQWWSLAMLASFGVAVWLTIRTYRQLEPARRAAFRLLVALTLGPIGLLVLISLPPLRPAYAYRYVLTSVIASMLLIGVGLAYVKFNRSTLLKRAVLSGGLVGVLIVGAVSALGQGNRNLDTGVMSLTREAVSKVNQAAGPNIPIITYSPYTYFATLPYETNAHRVYYTWSHDLYATGATRGLYDLPAKRGIKDLEAFVHQYPSVWIVAEEKGAAERVPASGWQQGRFFALKDSDTGSINAYAVEYRAP